MASSSPATGPQSPVRGALASAMIALTGTPDHSSSVDLRLELIARLAVERIAAAAYASITALRGAEYTTVAVSDDLIRAVDAIQYADKAGPCLEALDDGAPVGVPDIDQMVEWPGFHLAAPRLGLHASVSVPLFAGRGDPIAVLNLYGYDRDAMAPVIAGVCAVHGHSGEQPQGEEDLAGLDPGGRELVFGYAESLRVRATIQLAIELIRTRNRCGTDDAYLSLCIQAGAAGADLADTAAALIGRDL